MNKLELSLGLSKGRQLLGLVFTLGSVLAVFGCATIPQQEFDVYTIGTYSGRILIVP
jgi:hypothetical protein